MTQVAGKPDDRTAGPGSHAASQQALMDQRKGLELLFCPGMGFIQEVECLLAETAAFHHGNWPDYYLPVKDTLAASRESLILALTGQQQNYMFLARSAIQRVEQASRTSNYLGFITFLVDADTYADSYYSFQCGVIVSSYVVSMG